MRDRASSRRGRERAFHRTTQRNEDRPVTQTSYHSSGSFEDIKGKLEILRSVEPDHTHIGDHGSKRPQSWTMNGRSGMFMLMLLSVSMEGGESVRQYEFTKVDNGGLVFATLNLIQTKARTRKECALKCISKNNCVAFHWLPSGGTCQLVPDDNTTMNVQAGGGLELYQPEPMAKGAANTCIGLRNGKACVFPFTYLGQTFNGCTLLDDVKFWCSPVADYIAGSFMYEYCPFSCPINNPCC
ncbi:unnamed protein product [Darwinula stevensoni]|uniref:Apple domain-containing protein n=1 Tax=Darwinula stevensoni TaxID=69355 RepID=A0A7R9FRY8_9CRUS|nr:unnamed protein product [Darwinula stevensoni]CAG0902184.1 unnamed protein product [Darwinula stevensoni]